MDMLLRLFEGDSASRMTINLDAEDSRSSKSSGRATRPRRKGKEKTSKRARSPPRDTPTLRPLRHLCPQGRTTPPASPTAHGLQGGSAQSRWQRRRQ